MEKVVDNEKLMECMREKKKSMERKNLCTGSRYCISTNEVNTTTTSFTGKNYMKQRRNVKAFRLKQPYRQLFKVKVKNQIWH